MSDSLSKSLSSVQLWGIIVGTVLSGTYFGWNYALQFTSPVGLMAAVLIVTVFYTTFIFSFAEMATAIPNAGGSSEYAKRAMGSFGGFIAGFSCLVEFLFAVPAVALSVGAYINFLVPSIPAVGAAAVLYVFFIVINLFGVTIAAVVELTAVLLAIGGIVLFSFGGAGKINIQNIITNDAFFGGWQGILAALPFALWFYLGVEGGAMASEECKNPKKDIPKGFILGVVTLAVLAFSTLFITTGISEAAKINSVDSPLPTALAMAFGENSVLSRILSIIGLFGLISSLQGIIIGYSRQAFAMARAGYFPKFMSRTNEKYKAPVWAIVVPSLIGLGFILTKATAVVIVISVTGAMVQYIMSMVSLFILRRKEPELQRPYKVSYPVVPAIALVMAVGFLAAVTFANISTVIWVVVTYIAAAVFFYIYSKSNVEKTDRELLNTQAG